MVYAIAVLAVALVGIRPRRVPVWVWPLAGSGVLLALGFESPAGALRAIAQQWNVLLFILGLMGLCGAARESGALAWATDAVLARAGGSRRTLFVWLFLVEALTTLLLSNDATAIVLTPIVYAAVARREGDPMPYLFACAFVANTASFGLPFSNPANVLILPHVQSWEYLAHLGVPQIAALALNLGTFMLVFRRSLRGRYSFDAPRPASAAVKATGYALAGVAVLYFVALALSWPLGPVALVAALGALAVARISPGAAARGISWSTLALLAGLFVLLDTVARAGLVSAALAQLHDAARYGSLAIVAFTCGGAALLSNALNNLPVAIVASYVAARAPSQHLAYAAIVGVDLGPNLTTTGSLATLLWLAALAERGVRVSPLAYLRLGLLVVPPALAVASLWLWFAR
ncbi:MAG TPA: SLC13 family permease [Candidatus Tumulicola sp.]